MEPRNGGTEQAAIDKKKFYEKPILLSIKLIAESLQKTCMNNSEGCNDSPAKVVLGN